MSEFAIEFDYAKELEENTKYFREKGKKDKHIGEEPNAYYVTTQNTYYIAKAYMEGYNEQ